MKKHIYFENLDGLRFLCFLSVFFYHSFFTEILSLKRSDELRFIKRTLFENGNLGVNFFFVISGFLITYLLIEEKRLNGQINVIKFWLRRVFRIWPLFFLCVIIGFIGFPFLKMLLGQTSNESANIWHYLTFTNNFDILKNGLPDASILGVLWSVAIEEQFYLVWPIILYLLPIKRYWIAFSIIIIGSLIFRSFNNSYMNLEFHTISCISDMAIGAFGAWLLLVSEKFKNTILNLKRHSIFSIYTLFILIYFYKDEVLIRNELMQVFERVLIALVILFIILEQNFSQNSFFKISRIKLFTRLGRISYGLYCLHFIGILIAINFTKTLNINTELWQVILLETTLALTFTIIISFFCYRYFETPFLKMKEKYTFFSKT
jgi:peptidoglycan/LPS O-acetylase OafA/YrhL